MTVCLFAVEPCGCVARACAADLMKGDTHPHTTFEPKPYCDDHAPRYVNGRYVPAGPPDWEFNRQWQSDFPANNSTTSSTASPTSA